MKNFILVMLSVLFLGTTSFAQDKAAKPGKKATTKEATQPEAMKQPKLKKDGTPDMRYTENKKAAKDKNVPSGPLKKDGTPDMRHKANKEQATNMKK